MGPVILPHRGVAPRIHPEAYVADGAVIVGDVEIGAGSSVWFGCVLRGDVNFIRVGTNTNIQDGTVVHVNRPRDGTDYRDSGAGTPTLIGDDVTIGHCVLVHACTIESGAFVGMRATLMDEVTVEGGAMVAAGALVTPRKRVARGQLWGGSPAKHMRDLSDEERASWGPQAEHYAALGAEYRKAQSARGG